MGGTGTARIKSPVTASLFAGRLHFYLQVLRTRPAERGDFEPSGLARAVGRSAVGRSEHTFFCSSKDAASSKRTSHRSFFVWQCARHFPQSHLPVRACV